MKFENLLEGMLILKKYGASGYMSAEHDQIWIASARELKIPLSSIRKLFKLGFIIDEESWSAFI